MQNSRQQFGKESEAMAVVWLKKEGYKILEMNYRTPLGEIDIIARDRRTIAFVEVKARRSGRYGSPKGAITSKKKRTLSMAALCYLKNTGQNTDRARFDVVSIWYKTDGPEVEIIKNAFELAYP